MFIYLALCIFQLFQIDWSFYHIKFYIKEQFAFFLRSYDKFIWIKRKNRLYLARVCLNFYERILSKSIVYENSYRYRKNTSTTQKNIVNMFEHKALTILRYQIGDTNISYPFRFRLVFSGIHDAAAVVSIVSLKFENRFV